MITVAIDWGSTSFRAYKFNGSQVIDKIDAHCGVKTIAATDRNSAFSEQLYLQVGHWLEADDEVLLCGMVTSVNGWIETPYIPCPLQVGDIVRQLTTIKAGGRSLHFVPGVCQLQPRPDVMRGEEVQLLGLNADLDNSPQLSRAVVMPGTHSKWAILNGGTISRFKTIVTGELYDALLNHTLVGQLAAADQWCEQTFIDAVGSGYSQGDAIGQLFAARSGVLTNTLLPSQVSAYLSGLLIGCEIRSGVQLLDESINAMTIVGADSLTQKYRRAMTALGIDAQPAVPPTPYPDITAAGLASVIDAVHQAQ